MAKGRYSRTKATPKRDKEDTWFAPNMWGDSRYPIVKAALDSVDEVARTFEQRWGIGRLERLAPPELAVKFEQARQNFNYACSEQDDHNYMVQKANNLIAGWKALERAAEKNGHKPADPRVLYFRAPDDLDGKPYAIVEQSGDYKLVEPDTVKRIYSLDEICRIIQFWEEKNELANAVKDTFIGSSITSIKPLPEKKVSKEEFFDDEIPF